MASIKDVGKRVYNLNNSREKRRYYVFLLRSLIYRGELKRLIDFFQEDELRAEIFSNNPYPVEQVTRSFFYNKSTFSDRIKLVKNHFTILQKYLVPSVYVDLGCCDCDERNYEIYHSHFEEMYLQAVMKFHSGQRKEGLLSLVILLDGKPLYQIIFWLDKDKDGKEALWIGAMQGPNMENARDVVKKMTKLCHGYRTKNLILYMLQAVVRTLGIEKIYAVSNYGYYANNHVRSNRKLKTNFGDFWLEAGGKETDDERFYELPLVETRKTMEEVPTRKRAVYRRRFELLDLIDAEIDANVKKILK